MALVSVVGYVRGLGKENCRNREVIIEFLSKFNLKSLKVRLGPEESRRVIPSAGGSTLRVGAQGLFPTLQVM